MKRILYLSFTLLLSSCLSEKNAEPGKPSTFVRYFNGGNSDHAQVAEETADGGIIALGTTTISNDKFSSSKIKLIKTDQYGNVVWQSVYPPDFTSTAEKISASSLLQLSTGGFLIIGTTIVSPDKTAMYLLEVDANGTQKNQKTIDFGTYVDTSVQGHAIQLNSNGNYLVLGASSDATNNMILAELGKDLSVVQVRKYGTGASILSNRIFLDDSDNIVWSGTVTTTTSDIRFAKVKKTEWGPLDDRPIGNSTFNELGSDICRYGHGFALIGSTNEKINNGVSTQGADQDILLKIITGDGIELLSKPIPASGDTDMGNAIASVRGGVVILGTAKVGGQDDYYLAKYDAFGNEVWNAPRIFGNKTKNDTGASVRQLSDGSLLVFGTTNFGGVSTLMLMKADSEGNIE